AVRVQPVRGAEGDIQSEVVSKSPTRRRCRLAAELSSKGREFEVCGETHAVDIHLAAEECALRRARHDKAHPPIRAQSDVIEHADVTSFKNEIELQRRTIDHAAGCGDGSTAHLAGKLRDIETSPA